MGATVSAGADNDELVDNLLEADYIKTPAVERVFRAVDRGHYFTVECKHNAYKDLAWKYGNLHISAPSIYSEVMENLNLAPGMSFLNLGSGTGYLSTMAGLILGSSGINHGVEIHEDVTNYAKKKLEEFCSTSPALDEYEFCQPKFINGNCLHLGSEARQYDRVYCGVACPENHENYMKNLIKVGGILVMPINNQLLQIYRISDTNWETKSVLPVSFASLICGNASNTPEPLKMPDFDPLSLQDLCRFTVRSILRRKIDLEHPELKRKPSRVARKKTKDITLRKFMIPIYGSHSDSEDNEPEDPSEMRDFGRRGFLMDAHSLRSCRTFLEFGHLIPGPSRRGEGGGTHGAGGTSRPEATADGSDRLESAPVESPDPDANKSGSDFEMREAEIVSERLVEEAEIVAERLAVAADAIDQRSKVKREKFDSGIVEDLEGGRGGSSDSEIDCEDGGHSRQEENFFLNCLDSDTETAMSDSSSRQEESGNRETSGENGRNYSTYMKEKIRLLPLPMTLKYFVNLDREL